MLFSGINQPKAGIRQIFPRLSIWISTKVQVEFRMSIWCRGKLSIITHLCDPSHRTTIMRTNDSISRFTLQHHRLALTRRVVIQSTPSSQSPTETSDNTRPGSVFNIGQTDVIGSLVVSTNDVASVARLATALLACMNYYSSRLFLLSLTCSALKIHR